MPKKTAITGAGLVCSLGHTAQDTWDALMKGKSGIRPIEGFDASGFKSRYAAEVSGLEPQSMGIKPREARIMDTDSLMLIKAALEAWEESGIAGRGIDRDEIAYFAGMGMIDYHNEDLLPAFYKALAPDGSIDYDRFYTDTYREIYPLWPLAVQNNISFCQVAIRLGLRGENSLFTPHADSGAQAVWEAACAVLEGKAQAALVAGVSECVSPVGHARYQMAGVLSEPGECLPFAARRSGTVMGEGAGAIMLEPYDTAKERGVKPLALFSGYGAAFGIEAGAPCPTADAIARAMGEALHTAGASPGEIDVLIAHADGTQQGDANEAEAIDMVFGGENNGPAIYCSKGALGHMLAGSPVVDTVLAVNMLSGSALPASLTSEPLDDNVRAKLNTGGPEAVSPKKIMINAQSSEGQCASIIIEATTEATV